MPEISEELEVRDSVETEEPKSSFVQEKPVVLESILVDPNNAIDKSIEDAMVMMFETFDKLPEVKVPESVILPTDDSINLRLAQLGIDKKFKLEETPDKTLSYRSHVFDIKCKV